MTAFTPNPLREPMNQEQLDTIRLNVLNAGATIVASNRADLVELADYTDSLINTANAVPGNVMRVRALCDGVRNAPAAGDAIVYNERLHLLEWFAAIDELADAIAAKAQAVPSVPVDPLPEPPAE